MAVRNLTHERLLQVLDYSIVTGKFYWKVAAARRRKAGEKAGGHNALGYTQIQIDGENFLGHRLAFFYLHGEWPLKTLDHSDRNKSNNSWLNLREATYTEQNQNAFRYKEGRLPGVFRHRNGKPWSKIVVNKKIIPLGTFNSDQEAHEAYKAASLKYFGEFSPFFQREHE